MSLPFRSLDVKLANRRSDPETAFWEIIPVKFPSLKDRYQQTRLWTPIHVFVESPTRCGAPRQIKLPKIRRSRKLAESGMHVGIRAAGIRVDRDPPVSMEEPFQLSGTRLRSSWRLRWPENPLYCSSAG
jgi:hypothetical protein